MGAALFDKKTAGDFFRESAAGETSHAHRVFGFQHLRDIAVAACASTRVALGSEAVYRRWRLSRFLRCRIPGIRAFVH